MAADKYQTLVNGRETMVSASDASAGVANAGDIVALDASGKLDPSLLPAGVGPDIASIIASVALAAGDYVNIYDDAGTPKVRLADASNDRPAHGFVKTAVLSGASASVYFEGPNTDLTGLTIGARYYLGTAGAPTSAVPSLPGSVIHQLLGTAVSATSINTDIDDEIVL